jgi:hypothetical protein
MLQPINAMYVLYSSSRDTLFQSKSRDTLYKCGNTPIQTKGHLSQTKTTDKNMERTTGNAAASTK